MSVQPSPRHLFTPEERASYAAWRFGSTLDWCTAILVEIGYPVAELRWFVDAVQGICKGKEARIAHGVLVKRAQRFKNKPQARELAKRAMEADREWSRLSLRIIFDIERPRPNEMEGRDKRARTLYTDYLTPAAVWAQDMAHKIKKADEVRWKKETKYRIEKRREVLTEALKMLPGFDRVEDMPESVQRKEPNPLSLAEYIEQRESILLAENNRVLGRLCDGELIDADEIDKRLAALEVFHHHALHELEKSYRSTREVLSGLRKTRLQRALNLGEVDTEKGDADASPIPSGKYSSKGNAGIPLSDPPESSQEPGEPSQKGNAGITPAPRAEVETNKLQRACAIAIRSLCIFPVEPGGKLPLVKEWQRRATTDEEQIHRWWERWPQANIGLATGGGKMVLDVDPRHSGDASLTQLIEDYGPLPETLEVKTGGGGMHIYFALPEGVEIRNSAGKLGEGLDIRGDGGFVVAPGSIHASGRAYEISKDAPLAMCPAWIIEKLTTEPMTKAPNVREFREREATPSVGPPISEGSRNDQLFKIGCGIWGKGEAAHVADLHARLRETNAKRCLPPLDDSEVARIASSVAARYAPGV
jgi:hypothetical protein